MPNWMKCAVLRCQNNLNKDNVEKIKFFRFPNSPNLLNQWLIACGRDLNNLNVDNARVCSKHFTDDDYKLQDVLLNVPIYKRNLKEGAIPSKKLPYEPQRTEVDKIREIELRKELVNEAFLSHEDEGSPIQLELRKELVREALQAYEGSPTILIDDDSSMDAQDVEYLEEETATVACQTEVDPEVSKELELMCLQRENQKLKRENKNLKTELQEIQMAYTSLNEIFTPGQIKRLKYPKRRTKWDEEDIESALGLYSASSRVYELLCQRQYPLPSIATLRKWDKERKNRQSSTVVSEHQVADMSKTNIAPTLNLRKIQRKTP